MNDFSEALNDAVDFAVDEVMSQRNEHQLSDWLREKCEGLWDIRSTRSGELRGLDLLQARAHIQVNEWTREDMLEYHMGTINTIDHDAIHWALEVCTSKVAAIKYFIDSGTPTTLEQAQLDLRCIEGMLNANGRDEMRWVFISQYYAFWCSMGEEIYDIQEET